MFQNGVFSTKQSCIDHYFSPHVITATTFFQLVFLKQLHLTGMCPSVIEGTLYNEKGTAQGQKPALPQCSHDFDKSLNLSMFQFPLLYN